MHITEILAVYQPQLGDLHLDCNERVNLFLGPNASGKTTILRGIVGLYSLALGEPPPPGAEAGGVTPSAEDGFFYLNYLSDPDPTFAMRASDDWPRDPSGSKGILWDKVPFLYIPATRINLPVQNIFDEHISAPTIEGYEDIPDLLEKLFDNESGIFNGGYVEFAISAIRHMAMPGFPAPTGYQVRRVVDIGYSCAKSICHEVIYDEVTHPYVELREHESSPPARVVHYDMGIVTSDNILGEPLYAGALSSGTQGTLLWIWALAIKMAHHYNWVEGWEKKPAILLIDEIENHLHPTWQRRVIPALLEHFPGLQIFATTHSPFVVAGLKVGQVHLLERDENGAVTATPNTEDIVGWTADEILRNMMGVDEPTDQLTVDRANRLRQLREKDRLTDEEESELNELRRQVNEDLLSKGGPLEAQRERYGELMERFLLSRQSELTQDGD